MKPSQHSSQTTPPRTKQNTQLKTRPSTDPSTPRASHKPDFPSCPTGEEQDLHIWKHPEDQNMVATYTLSTSQRAICHALPLDDALRYLREYLEAL